MSVLHTEVTDLDRLYEDFNLPSLAYQAHENVPIFIPLSHKSIALGMGFDSSIAIGAQASSALFRPSALISTSGKALYELDMEEGCSSFRQSSSSKAATSYEHMDFKGALSAGRSVFGVTGRARFTQDVSENSDSNKVSAHSSLRVGLVKPTVSPRLSPDALSLLQTSPSTFHSSYGDYFLGALCIGADTSTFLSTSSSIDLHAEMRSIEVEAHFLGESETVYSDYKQSQSIASTHDIKFSAFDTLSGFQSTVNAVDAGTYMEVRRQAVESLAGGLNLEARVRGLMKTLGLNGETQLTERTCKELCQSGLVVELMFLPYCGLKDYVAVMSVGSSLSGASYE